MMRTIGISMAALLAVAACDSGDSVGDLRTNERNNSARSESPYTNDADDRRANDGTASAPATPAGEPGMMATDEADAYDRADWDAAESTGQNKMAMTEEPAKGVWTFKDENDVAWAGFGPDQDEVQFSMTCELAQGDMSEDNALIIRRAGHFEKDASRDMTILTDDGSADVAMERMDGNIPAVEGRLPMTDPFVEQLKRTGGTVTVELETGDRLIMPAGDAIAEVIEACSAS